MKARIIQRITIAILKPSPNLPSKFSFGMQQSSNIKLHVEEAFIPSLSSFFPRESPLVGFGTINALMPFFNKINLNLRGPHLDEMILLCVLTISQLWQIQQPFRTRTHLLSFILIVKAFK